MITFSVFSVLLFILLTIGSYLTHNYYAIYVVNAIRCLIENYVNGHCHKSGIMDNAFSEKGGRFSKKKSSINHTFASKLISLTRRWRNRINKNFVVYEKFAHLFHPIKYDDSCCQLLKNLNSCLFIKRIKLNTNLFSGKCYKILQNHRCVETQWITKHQVRDAFYIHASLLYIHTWL